MHIETFRQPDGTPMFRAVVFKTHPQFGRMVVEICEASSAERADEMAEAEVGGVDALETELGDVLAGSAVTEAIDFCDAQGIGWLVSLENSWFDTGDGTYHRAWM